MFLISTYHVAAFCISLQSDPLVSVFFEDGSLSERYIFSLPGGNGIIWVAVWAEADSPLGRNMDAGTPAEPRHFTSPRNSVAEFDG